MLQHVIPHRSTMIIHFPQWDNKVQTRFSDQGISDKEQLKCDYCRRTKHTRETYWKLYGRSTRGHGGERVGLSDHKLTC